MKLKGTSTGTGTSRKVKWTVEAKAKIYALVKNQGVSAKEAFTQVADELGLGELPASYTGYPHSHIWRFQKELGKRVEKGDQEVISLLRSLDLIAEDEPQAAEEAEANG